jgi:hypothetical protein
MMDMERRAASRGDFDDEIVKGAGGILASDFEDEIAAWTRLESQTLPCCKDLAPGRFKIRDARFDKRGGHGMILPDRRSVAISPSEQ